MYLYINGFRCASSDSKEEVAIQFTLDGPLFKEDGSCSNFYSDVKRSCEKISNNSS